MIVIGLTGSIGMGKSTCGKMLQDLGVPVHESDLAAHDILSNDINAQQSIIAAFPELQLPINRKALGQIVFNNDDKLKVLEEILHPLVQASQAKFIDQKAKEDYNIIALDIPLLYETGADKRTDYVMVVSASAENQKKRVLSRPNMSDKKFQAILNSQMADSEKRKSADFVISTDCDPSDTIEQIKTMLNAVKKENP